MLLRTRLLLATIAVVIAALATAGTTTYLAFRSAVLAEVDQSLREVALPLGPDDDADSVRGPVPTVTPFVQTRSSEGMVLVEVPAQFPDGHQASPDLPEQISTPGVSDLADGPAAFSTAEAVEGGTTFRVKASTGTSGEQLIIALPIDEELATLRQLAVIEVVVAGLALLVAGALGWWLVRVGLTPLTVLTTQTRGLGAAGSGTRVDVPQPVTEVGELGQSINGMLDEVDDAFADRLATEARLRRFIGDASHELRTPIAAVSAYAELFDLGAQHNPDDLRRSMDGIRRETARMRDLTEDLLVLARLDEARPGSIEAVDLATITANAVTAARLLDPTRTITSDLGPATVPGDAHRLRQCLDNLLANVRAHTPDGTHAHVTLSTTDHRARLMVSDDGPGVPAEDLPAVFDRFWRADSARSRTHGGNGLGLAIVAAVVASHRGTVVAEASPNGGLTVIVDLPTVTENE
jgi:two-component system OmpR family sensor kinase